MLFGLDWYRTRLSRAVGIDVDRRAALAEKCRGVESAEEAWELSAPDSWALRSFVFAGSDGTITAMPSSPSRVRAFCANPATVETAEMLAREMLARLVAHGARPGQTVRWRFWPWDLWRMGALPPAQWTAESSALTRAAGAVKDAVVDDAIVRVIEATARDRLMVSIALSCARWDATDAADNPFEPLVELYATGAALVSLSPLELAIAD